MISEERTAATAGLNRSRVEPPSVTTSADPTTLADYVRSEADVVEAALVERDPTRLADAPGGPDTVVDHLFTDAFVVEHTDFPSLGAFLEHAGVESVWALAGWIDWVLDWHVLGNTRFWSWEWMTNAAVELARDAALVGPVRCRICDWRPDPVTGSSVEEPGRVDETWVRFACPCGATGRVSLPRPTGETRCDGDVAVVGSREALSRPPPDDGED